MNDLDKQKLDRTASLQIRLIETFPELVNRLVLSKSLNPKPDEFITGDGAAPLHNFTMALEHLQNIKEMEAALLKKTNPEIVNLVLKEKDILHSLHEFARSLLTDKTDSSATYSQVLNAGLQKLSKAHNDLLEKLAIIGVHTDTKRVDLLAA